MMLTDKQRDAVEWAIGPATTFEYEHHVAALREILQAATPVAAGAVALEQIGVQEAWEAAGGNPGIKATREQLVTALKMLDGSNEDADFLGDLVRDAIAHLYAGQVGLARACLARATEVTFTGAAKALAVAPPSDAPQNVCPVLTSSERVAIERAIAALTTDPVSVSVLESLLRAAPVAPSDEGLTRRGMRSDTITGGGDRVGGDASRGAAALPHAAVLTDEMRLAIGNAILALDQGVAAGSEHASDLRFVLAELDRLAVPVQAAVRKPVAYIISGPGGDGLAWAKDLHNVRADLTRTPLCRCQCSASVEHSNVRKLRHYNAIYNTDPVQRACGELPEGWEIRISLEKGAGTIDVYDPDGNNVDFDSDADLFDWRIHEAVDTALECATGEAAK